MTVELSDRSTNCLFRVQCSGSLLMVMTVILCNMKIDIVRARAPAFYAKCFGSSKQRPKNGYAHVCHGVCLNVTLFGFILDYNMGAIGSRHSRRE